MSPWRARLGVSRAKTAVPHVSAAYVSRPRLFDILDSARPAASATGAPEFAVRCADNKLMTVMMIAMNELDTELGADIGFLEARTLVGAFTRLTKDLIRHVRERETFAEEWLKNGKASLAPSRSAPAKRRLRAARS